MIEKAFLFPLITLLPGGRAKSRDFSRRIGANTSYYHGHHAYFDGAYYRIAPLDDKKQQSVVEATKSGKVPEE